MCIRQRTHGGEATKVTPRTWDPDREVCRNTNTGGKMNRHPFVSAYPVTEVVSGHPHIGDQEHKWETASMERKKIKQKAGISHMEFG